MIEDDDLRACFAMFALAGAIMSRDSWTPQKIWEIADEMVEAKNQKEPDKGIVAVKRRFVKKEK